MMPWAFGTKNGLVVGDRLCERFIGAVITRHATLDGGAASRRLIGGVTGISPVLIDMVPLIERYDSREAPKS